MAVSPMSMWDVKKHLCEQDPEWALPEEQQLFSTSDENQLKNGGSCFSLFCVVQATAENIFVVL